jgi:hypothetical protein
MSENDTPQQLTLLPSSDVPVRFRLDADTRRRGLQHVAQIRQQLAERQAARAASNVEQLPIRRPIRSTAA